MAISRDVIPKAAGPLTTIFTAFGETDRGVEPSYVSTFGAGLKGGRDDFLNAMAALWTAKSIRSGEALRFPAVPDLDCRGLNQAILF